MQDHVFAIPEFDCKLRLVADQMLQLVKAETEQVLDTHMFETDIKSIRQVAWNRFEGKDGDDGKFYVKIDFVEKVGQVRTQSEYILDLNMSSPTRAHYFGLYEVGTVVAEGPHNLRIEKLLEVAYVRNGFVTPDQMLYATLREGSMRDGTARFYLVKYDWTQHLPPLLVKHELDQFCDAIFTDNQIVYLGLRSGILVSWELATDQVVAKLGIFDDSLATIDPWDSKLVVTSAAGELALIDPILGEISWKRHITPQAITGILIEGDLAHIVDIGGYYVYFDLVANEILDERQLPIQSSCRSNILRWLDWLIYTTGEGIYGVYLPNMDKHVHQPLVDPLIRRLAHQQDNVLTGDDEGILSVWRIGKLTVGRTRPR